MKTYRITVNLARLAELWTMAKTIIVIVALMQIGGAIEKML